MQEQEGKQNNNAQSIQADMGLNMERLKMETIQRLSKLGDVICSDDFQKYSAHQRQQILMDFAYYSKVADSVL
jgi:hypothetical protein